jgi:RHS repeat-associated protein
MKLTRSSSSPKFRLRSQRRRSRFEVLEARLVLDASISTNLLQPLDANNDSIVSAADALVVINDLFHRNSGEPNATAVGNYSLDTNCSGSVTALDALRVINALSRQDQLATWSFDASTEPEVAGGRITPRGCQPHLVEGGSYVTQLITQVRLPYDNVAVELTFDSPEFDVSSAKQIRDSFEIAILDRSGQPIVQPLSRTRDAVFNWTEGYDPVMAPGVRLWEANETFTITVNLSGLSAGEQVQVVARLLNNDQDNQTGVTLGRVNFVSSAAIPAGELAITRDAITSSQPIDQTALELLTSSVSAEFGQTSARDLQDVLVTELRLRNESNFATTGPLVAVIDRLSDPTVQMLHPDGRLHDGRPYFVMSTDRNTEALAPGEATLFREIAFSNPLGVRFRFSVETFGRIAQAPDRFSSVPLTQIEAGRNYRYEVLATHAETLPITYQLVVAPEGLIIDRHSGVATWQTESDDIGSHQVVIRASAPGGAYIDQNFTVEVVSDLENRPPVFVSQPSTEAIVAGSFEVITMPTGSVPAGLAVGDFGVLENGLAGTADSINALSLVSINQGSQTISLIPGLGRDGAGREVYGTTQLLSVGEPPINDNVLRGVLDIDLGLPPLGNPSYDSNRIMGLAHGDFNGDGILDVASSIVFQSRPVAGPDAYERRIALTLGRGDGTFEAPLHFAVPGPVAYTWDDVGAISLQAKDFDLDGKLDLLVSETKGKKLLFYKGLGNGILLNAIEQSTGTDVSGYKVADLTGDGILDLIAMRADSAAFGVLLGVGDGTFQPYAEFSTHTGFTVNHNFAIGDLNGDGWIDFVSGNHATRTLNVYLGNGDGTFTRGVDLASRGTFSDNPAVLDWSMALVIGDFSGDGQSDIAYTTISNSGFGVGFGGGIGLYEGDGSGATFTWSTAVNTAMSQAPSNVHGEARPVDLNSDGHLDLVFTGPGEWGNFAPGVNVALNDGTGKFTSTFWIDSNLGTHSQPSNLNNALGVLVGDFNNDGMLDLLTARSGRPFTPNQFSSVSLMLADTPGTYRAAYDVRAQSGMWGSVSFVEYADFNNDGILDLWGPAYQNPSFSQLGIGDGKFQQPITATPWIGNEGLGKGFATDLDLDGNMDVVWSGQGGVQGGPQGRYLAALGNGDGTFQITYAQTGNNTPSGYAPLVIKPADFDGDGYTDFVALTGLNTIEIMRNVPEVPGTFSRSYSVPFGALPLRPSLNIGDFDGDGVPDVIAVRERSGNVHDLLFYQGVGDGTLHEPTLFPFAPDTADFRFPKHIAVGDLNSDGNLDFVINASYHRSAVVLGNGDGTFQTPTVYRTGTIFGDRGGLHLIDLNDDGHLDMVSMDDTVSQRAIEVRLGIGNGTFGKAQLWGTSEGTGHLAFGDLDNDGRVDIGINGDSRQEAVATFLGNRQGLSGVLTTDINVDGHTDILAINHDNSHVKRMIGDGRGSFTRLQDLLVGAGPVDLLSGDFGGDGGSDFVTINRSGRSISVMLADGLGGFARTDVPVGRRPVAGALGKVTGGEHDDLLVIDAQLNAMFVLIPDSSGGFVESALIPLGDTPTAIAVGELDGDRTADVIISMAETNRLMILRSLGERQFADPTYVNLPTKPGKLAAADLNGDGLLDLAVTFPETGEVALLFGMGQSRFTQPQRVRVGSQPDSIVIADANRDGLLDILVTNAGDDTASVILNRFDPNQLYRYDALAIDPDDDPVTYSIVEGPGGMILDAESGAIRWAPSSDQLGFNRLVLQAHDGRGGSSTQEFTIHVEPARTNTAPVITTLPSHSISASEMFTHTVSAIDPENDRLRYRLLDGPAGSTIDPISGLLEWDPRGNAMQFNSAWGAQGQVQIDHQNDHNVDRLTIEGWFRFAAASGNQVLVNKALNWSTPAFYTLRYFSGALQFLIGDGTAAGVETLSIAQPIQPAEWIHLAATFDDSTGMMTLLVNGNQVASKETSKRIGTAGASIPLYIGSDVYPFTGDAFGLRLWSEPLSSAALTTAMHQQFGGQTPNSFIDLRFNEGDALTVLNHSSDNSRGLLKGSIVPRRITGLAAMQTARFTVAVEDGKGGLDRQTLDVTVKPQLLGSISGTLFQDDNGDALKQPGELPLTNWTVFIDTNGNGYRELREAYTTTDAAGQFQFHQMLAGSYPVAVEAPSGFNPVATQQVSVTSQLSSTLSIPARPAPLGQLRGGLTHADSFQPLVHHQVFADLNGNGFYDSGEPNTFTDQNGNYALSGLAAGNYSVRTSAPSGWLTTSPVSAAHDVALGSEDLLADLDFVLAPRDSLAALAPMIVSQPPRTAEVHQAYHYAVAAISPDGRSIGYSLSLAPTGMVIDPSTGRIVWTPTGEQSGSQQVIVRAATDNSSVDLQSFVIQVAATNTAPIVVSRPISPAVVSRPWSYPVVAQDAEQTDLVYELDSAPAGATIAADSGLLQWTPNTSHIGEQSFLVSIHDPVGGVAKHAFELQVVADAPTTMPFAIRAPRADAALLNGYLSRVSGVDSTGQPLSAELLTGPSGLNLDASGLINWQPTVAQLGMQTLQVRFRSVSGDIEDHAYSIHVRQTVGNSAPRIESTPSSLFATVDQLYVYDLFVTDNDHDALSFEIVAAPDGMSIHPQLGTLRWLPTLDQLGQSTVTLRVVDPHGGAATQSFIMTTRRLGGPPLIQSVPATHAAVGNGYLYSVLAVDAEKDPLTFRLIEAPDGMTLDSRTGEIVWTPTVGQLGQHAVFIAVSDALGNRATQSFAIQVAAGLPNLAPVILSLPNSFAAVSELYRYDFQSADPEGTLVTYSLRRGPAGMTVDSQSGQVTWTPTAGHVGRTVVTFVATDAQGGAAVQSFEIDVLGVNFVPQIISTPPTFSWAGGQFQYDVIARDADRDPIRYEFSSSVPAGMTLDALGRIRWQTSVADIGSHSITVRANDPRGGMATQQIEFEVRADNVSPKVTVLPRAGGWPWDGPVVVLVSAVDNVGVTDVELFVNDVRVPLDANRTARLAFEDWGPGVLNMVARAVDAAGNEATGTGISFYRDPEFDYESGEGLPVATIRSPSGDGTVYGMVEIFGTAMGGTAAAAGFKEYRLSYAPLDQLQFTEFVHNTTPVTDGLLGVWDTTLLENDSYVIRLEVTTDAGNTSVHDVTVGLSGELKLGNFRVSFEDLSIPVAGIPITVLRTYDTLRSDRDGDFGFGWRLEYRSTDLRTSLPKSGLEDLGIYTPFKPGTKVYLTLPGGQRQGFTFDPEIRVLPGFGRDNNLVLASPRFRPDRGVTSTLSAGGGQLFVNEFGELYAAGGIPWNPAAPDFGGGYTVTTADGIRYRIDGSTGLMQSAMYRNGNTLDFTDAGITSSVGGLAVTFERDRFNRITVVSDPAGNSIRYSYSPQGDLIRIIDREGHATQFTYRADHNHFLDSIVDPLGREGLRVEYNQDGRLTSLISGESTANQYRYDFNNQVIETQNGDGMSTFTEYDDRGNVVSITRPNAATTRFAYDDANNIIARTDAMGATTRFGYDTANNLISITDPLGNATHRTFDRFRNLTSTTNPLGAVTRKNFDTRGNLIESIDEEGAVTSYLRDADGLLTTIVEPNGATTSYEVDRFGRVSAVTNALGATFRHDFDALGRILSITTSYRLPDGGESLARQTFQYDRNGNIISMSDANNATTLYEYDATGQEVASVDALGNRTQYERDTGGRLSRIRLPNGAITTYQYNSQDQVIAITDSLLRTTRFQYDVNGRLVAEIHPDETPDDETDNPRLTRQYDVVGQLIRETNELGFEINYRYDLAGRAIEVRDAIGAATRYLYDAAGRTVSEERPTGVTLSYSYDQRGNQTAIRSPDGAITRYHYDHLGNVTQKTDALNRVTRWTYDLAGNLATVIDASGAKTSYFHDALGRLVHQTDAALNSTYFAYDLVGNRTSVVDPLGAISSHAFDGNGNLLATTSPNDQIIRYVYNEVNQLVERRYSFNGITYVETFTYTLTGQRESVTDSRGVTRYRYDIRDRLVERIDPDGLKVNYSYDAAGRLTEITTLGGTDSFEYNAHGNITQIVDSIGGTTVNQYDEFGRLVNTIFSDLSIQERSYDDLGRLASLRSLDSDGGQIYEQRFTHDLLGRRLAIDDSQLGRLSYSYDVLGRLVTEQTESTRISYSYDAVGNRLSRQHSELGTTQYEYGPGNQLVRENGPSVTREFFYDDSGNLILIRAGGNNQSEFTFDPLGRMTRGTVVDGVTSRVVEYLYDVDGDLVAKSIDGEQAKFIVDDFGLTNRIAEVDQAGNVQAKFVYDGLRRIGAIYDGASVSIHEGTVGTVRLVTSAGQPAGSFVYDAFGNLIDSDGLAVSFGFGGGMAEHELALVGLRARFYDPAIGRFISVDPFEGFLTDPASKHPYLYAHADPINVYDPSGMVSLIDALGAVSLISGLAGIGAIAVGNDDLAFKLELLSVGTGLGAVGLSVAKYGVLLGRDLLLRKAIQENAKREAAELAARATAEGVTAALVRETDLVFGSVAHAIRTAAPPASTWNMSVNLATQLNSFVLNLASLEREYATRWISAKLLELSADATLTPTGREVVTRVIAHLTLTATPF